MSRRLALVVANDSYTDPGLTSLFAPRHDAQSLRELLRDPEIGNFEPAHLLVNESKSEIERAMEEMFRSARPGDLVLLYFSGHGVRSRNARLHLAVTNTDLRVLAASSVSASFIKELVDESDASSTIILLDCCYSGAFSDGRVKADPGVDVGHELQAGRGTYVLTASSSVETAGDGAQPATGRPPSLSAFTEAVVRGLRTGSADVRGLGRISPHDLWEYVRHEVPRRTTRQTPTQYGYVEDEVHLARVRRGFSGTVATPTHRVHLGDLLGPLSQTAERGLRAEEWLGTGRLVVPVGQVFRGAEPAETVCLDLAHGDGHVLLVGRIGSGKSTLLRTLIGSLALTNGPDEVCFYFLESGGNKLGSLRQLPYVARIARDDQQELVREVLDEVRALIARRKQLYGDHFVDSAERFRALRRELPGGPHPDVFLVVDRWSDFAAHGPTICHLASVGLDYGVHVVVATRSWRDVPDELQDLVHCQIEFHLGRASESRIDPKLAEQVAGSQPGWALRRGGRFLVALPHLAPAAAASGAGLPADFSDGALELVDRVAKAWSRISGTGPGPGTPSGVPLLPDWARPGADGSTPAAGGADPGDGAPSFRPRRSGATDDFRERPAGTGSAARSSPPLGASPSVLDLLQLTELSRDRVRALRRVGARWAGIAPVGRLSVPIGVDVAGTPFPLDLTADAEGGIGPHGLLIGATGSGKSELLRTLITTLALTRDPTRLNVVLVEFKGSALSDFAPLPHTAGVVTNIADDLTLADRLAEALSGELVRRQRQLRSAGKASQPDYQAAREGVDGPSEPMPDLLVVFEEFTELLAVRPDFMEVLVQIGRLGRALGLHLLLASQRFEEEKLRGLDAYLSYRIAMRTFSAVESRLVIGTPDAYELPRSPGHAYLKAGGEPARRLVVASSSGPAPATGSGETVSVAEATVGLLSTLDLHTRPVLLPPLADSPTLGVLLDAWAYRRGASFQEDFLPPPPLFVDGPLSVPLAVVDRPSTQERTLLTLDLTGPTGQLAVVGGPRSGKSTLVRTLVCGLALTHTPDDVHVYCLDLGGGALTDLADLPHVGAVAGRDPDLVRRTIGDVTLLLDDRERDFPGDRFAEHRRQLRHDRESDGRRAVAEVFLVVDGWSTLRGEYEDLEPLVVDIAGRGLPYGVHVVVTATRWGQLRPSVQDLFGTRLELRLADPTDSAVHRKAANRVPVDAPGRGITSDGEQMLTAVPVVERFGPEPRDLVRAVAETWPDTSAPPVRLLPALVPYAELDLDTPAPLRLPIGLTETGLRPVAVDFEADPHLLVFGDVECGKSAFLRALATTITRRFTPGQARMILVDHRRSLLGAVDSDHLLGYGTSTQTTASLVESVAGVMQDRLPRLDVTVEQLRTRSWWTGPELFVLVDDYDLVVGTGTNPLQPLLEYLPQARDIGLHLVLARRSGGAGRAVFEPLVQRLRELASPTLIMSGDPAEGALAGNVRPRPLPAGRGQLVRRREGTELVQLAYLPPPE